MSSAGEPHGETQLDGLGQRLRELPSERAPPFDWREFERRARHPDRLRALRGGEVRAALGVRAAAVLAACIVLGIAASALWSRVRGPRAAPPPTELSQRSQTQAADSAGAFPAPTAAALLAQAEAAERWLSSDTEGPAIVRVSTHVAIAGLEDRIASLDDQLDAAQLENSGGVRLGTLRLERARLIDDLAQVRYAESLVAATR